MIQFRLRRREWLHSEWPAVLFWFGLAGLTLLVIGWAAVTVSAWITAVVVPWLFCFHSRVLAILGLLVRGRESVRLLISLDGRISVAFFEHPPVSVYWKGFQNQGETFLLWGGDGRYRLVIPRRALRDSDFEQVHRRIGVDLGQLAVNEEVALADVWQEPKAPGTLAEGIGDVRPG